MAGDLIRKRQLEKIAEVMPFPCRFNYKGCSSLQPYKELAEHEKYCNFRSVSCPNRRRCGWSGPLSNLVNHLATEKPNLIKIYDGDSVSFSAGGALKHTRFSEWRMVQYCFGKAFMFILINEYYVGETMFCALVQLLGTKKESEKFTYSLELTSSNDTTLAWKGTPIPYHDGIQDVIGRSNCLIFNEFSARNFARNGVLTFDVKILEKPQQ